MSKATYLRAEIVRTFRNRRFLLFSLGFPLVLFLAVGGANKDRSLSGIGFALYYMSGMVAWGSMVAIVSSGARISTERQTGWTRQLRITPLRTRTYFTAKIVCGYLLALLTIVVLYVAGLFLDVHLRVSEWATMTGLVLVGLVPFAVLGVLRGHLVKPDSLGPAVGGITSLFALLGGAWGPLGSSRVLTDAAKCLPSFWLVQSAKVVLHGPAWPPAEEWVVLAVWTLALGRLAVLVYQRDTARV